MTKYLITASLINSFAYYQNDEWRPPEVSRADFLKTLSRERFTPNEAMQKGIDFEAKIEGYCSLVKSGCEHAEQLTDDKIVSDIGNIVSGGLWQESCKKDMSFNGFDIILYGRCDVIKADTIYDIKYTGKYETGKFQDSIQHLIYLYCLDLPKFSYLVSNGKDWWKEDYSNGSNVEDNIRSKVSDFFEYLKSDIEAKRLFHSKWQSKY